MSASLLRASLEVRLMADEKTSTPFLLTIPTTPMGDSFSIAMKNPDMLTIGTAPVGEGFSLVMKNTDTLKLLQPEVYICVKGHKVRGFDVKWCPVCYEEWLAVAFPMTKDPT